MIYVLDHYYATDHMEHCRLINIDKKDEREVAEILMAIQLYFEQKTGKADNPDLDSVVKLLERRFNAESLDKDIHGSELWEMLNYLDEVDYTNFEPFSFDRSIWTYIDLQQTRDTLTGTPAALFKKWLTPGIMADIVRLPAEK